ncbi:MAG: DUF5654 family protein [Candidatus Moranbacteria bacterium]|nr:DUF5654 family protein [Candidatus Moranbacteria bacterium]
MKSELLKEGKRIRSAVRERTISYILAAFGLVAGLAWNEAIKSFIEYVFPIARNTLLAKFVYAAVLTLVLVFISIYLVNIFRKEEKEEENTENKL